MNKNFLLKKNNHITSVDVLNKFLSKSSFKTIKIERIQFKFSSKDFIPLSHNLESLNIISRLNILTLIYLMLGIFPHITAVKKKILKKTDTNNKEDLFLFDAKISNKNEISNFMSKLVTEYEFLENNLEIDNLNNITIQNQNKISYNTKISFGQFFDNQEFVNAQNSDCNLNKTFISTNFIFSKALNSPSVTKNRIFYKMLWNN